MLVTFATIILIAVLSLALSQLWYNLGRPGSSTPDYPNPGLVKSFI